MDSTFLQIFLLVNVFIIGGLTVTAAKHAYAHFRPQKNDTIRPLRPQAQIVHLPPDVKEHLLNASKEHFQAVLSHSANELEKDLKETSAKLDKQLNRLGTEIVINEMKRYRMDLEEIRKQAEAVISGAQSDIVEHQAELKANLAKRQTELEAKLTADITAEKQLVIQQIDSKLADSVISFLTEAMQHNIDLGSQTTYLTAMLDEHKAEIIKEIVDEA